MQNLATSAHAEALANRDALTAAFNVLDHVIEGRNTFPILSNARIIGDGESLFITGTDLDAEIVVRIAAAAGADFDCTIPAKQFKILLKGAPKADYVALSATEGTVSADFEAVKYKLQALPSSDFPEMVGPGSDATHFEMDGAEFRKALARVSGAMSSEETRYYLNGIFFTQLENEFRMVATDGHRLYCQAMPVPSGMKLPAHNYQTGVIIPRNTVDTLNKLLKGKACPDRIQLSSTNRKIRISFPFEFGDITVTSKLVDGTFPDYQRVMPAHPPHDARFQTSELADKIKACSLVSSEKKRAFKLSISGAGSSIDVNNPDMGAAHAELACEWSGEEFEIGFNARYALEALAAIGADTVKFGLTDSGSPTVLTGPVCDGFQVVLMPMRV